MTTRACAWVLGVSVFALWHGAGWAQTAAVAQPAPAPTASPTVAEVIVTAQKRETRLESTPVAVSVVTGAALSNQGIYELKDLKADVPGLNINEAPGGLPGISIRGIGTTSASQLFEQSVGLFVDGVYNPRAREFTDAIFDVSSVEVIKGSQGVLFGKNTSVGAISITSNRPSKTFDGYVEGDYETEFGSAIAKGAVDIPLSDTFQMRLSALYDHDGGYVYDVTQNRYEEKSDRYLLRGMFEWEPTGNVDILLKLQGGHSGGVGNTYEFAPSTSPLLPLLGVADSGDVPYQKYENSEPLGDTFDRQDSYDPTLIAKVNLGDGYTLTSTTGYSYYNYSYGFDSDNTPEPFIYNLFGERFNQISEEVRLSSPIGQHFDYIVGAFYLHQVDLFDYQLNFFHTPLIPDVDLTGRLDQYLNQDENDYAGFGQFSWHMTDKLNLTVGGRLNEDDKRGAYDKVADSTFGDPTSLLPFVLPGSTDAAKIDDLSFDVTGTLSYAMTPHSVAYVSIGRGTKGGAFNNTSVLTSLLPTPFTVPEEQATTYEGGIKGRFLDGRGYAALSLYHLDISDFQDSYYSAAAEGFLIRSIDAQSTGAEFEGQYQLTSWLNLYGNSAWTPVAKLADGERTQRSPKWTALVGVRGSEALGADWKATGDLNLDHSSSFYNQPSSAPGDNLSGDFDILDARIAFTYRPADVEVSLTASNLTDARYKEFSFGSVLGVGTVVSYNRPRTLMVGLKKTF